MRGATTTPDSLPASSAFDLSVEGGSPLLQFAKAPDAQAKRQSLDPPVTLLPAFLFQVLHPAMPYQEVVGKVRASFITRRVADKEAEACKQALVSQARPISKKAAKFGLPLIPASSRNRC